MELIIVFKKENPGQFVRAQCCASGSTRSPCKGNMNILLVSGNRLICCDWDPQSATEFHWRDREQCLTLFKAESVHDPRKPAAVVRRVQFTTNRLSHRNGGIS